MRGDTITKFLLGVAVGYVFRDMIDGFVTKAKTIPDDVETAVKESEMTS